MNKSKYNEEERCEAHFHRQSFEARLLASAKSSAKKRNLEFTICKEDIQIPRYCKYLGVELTNVRGGGRRYTNPSLDRINSSKGYVKENIQIISDLANRMKQDATPEQLLSFAKNIIKMNE